MAELTFFDISEVGNLKIHGRTLEDRSPLPLFWNHSGVEVNCTGSELWIDLEVDCSFHEPWIAYELNGAFMSRQMLLSETKSICIYRSMVKGVSKNVRFYRELQAMHEDDNCHVLVKGFRTDGEFLPVEDNKLKFEFIGDSITSGEGTYGSTKDTEWLAMYMSSSRHYASIIEKAMKADIRIISQGGWGVYCGWDNDVRHNIPSVYEPVCGLAWGTYNKGLGADIPYDFSSWPADAVIINLGTNDASAFNQPPLEVPGVGLCKQHKNSDGSFVSEDAKKVTDSINKFLKMVRKNNPKAHIVWVYGMLGYDLEGLITSEIGRYKEETGDENVAYLRLPCVTEETFGAHMHPGYANHIEAARVLGAYLSEKFGVEYKEPQGNL